MARLMAVLGAIVAETRDKVRVLVHSKPLCRLAAFVAKVSRLRIVALAVRGVAIRGKAYRLVCC
jgi:hypothetical protein